MTSTPIFQSVAIIGAGLLGHGIGLVHALGGSRVVLCDLDQAILDRARSHIAKAADTLIAAGEITSDQARTARDRITMTTDLVQALKGADYIVEAITEDIGAKTAIFAKIAEHAAPDAVVTSNTSYLDVFPLMPDALQDRAFIVHWYTPPYIVDLVDLVATEHVPEALSDRVFAYLQQLGKKPVRLKKFISGYVANRVQMAIEAEIFRLLDDGIADAEDIDVAIREGLGLRLTLLGQFRKIDYTGLQLVHGLHALGVYEPPNAPTTGKRIAELAAEGRTGVISGSGFHDYTGQSAEDLFAKRDADLLEMRQLMRRLRGQTGTADD